MTKLYIRVNFDLTSKIKLVADNLNTVVLNENGRLIEISPPRSYVKSDQTQAQSIEICIIEEVDLNTTTLDEINSIFSKIAEPYFLRICEIIRLHTRQYDFGNPQAMNAMKQNRSAVYDATGKQLHRMNNIAVYLKPEDKKIYPLDRAIWQKVVEYLVEGKAPELYLLLLLDGKYYAQAGRVRESIIMLAVGVEQFTVEHLKRDKYAEESKMKFADFFDDAVTKAKGKSLKKDRNDDYHRINYLFSARNNIAHGKECYLNIGKDETAIVEKVLSNPKVSENCAVEINQFTARDLSDDMIALIDWITLK